VNRPLPPGDRGGSKRRSYRGIRMWKAFAWRWQTGPENCGASKMNAAQQKRGDEAFLGTARFLACGGFLAKGGLFAPLPVTRRNAGRLWRTAGVRGVSGLAPDGGKPPRWNPGGSIERRWRESTLDRVGPPPVFGLGGNNGQPHLLAERTGNESPNRMGLPCSRGHQLTESYALRAFHQIENRSGLAAGSRAFRFLRRLLARFGFRRWYRRTSSLRGLSRFVRAWLRCARLSGGRLCLDGQRLLLLREFRLHTRGTAASGSARVGIWAGFALIGATPGFVGPGVCSTRL
jgi:hypothetical protein